MKARTSSRRKERASRISSGSLQPAWSWWGSMVPVGQLVSQISDFRLLFTMA